MKNGVQHNDRKLKNHFVSHPELAGCTDPAAATVPNRAYPNTNGIWNINTMNAHNKPRIPKAAASNPTAGFTATSDVANFAD